MALEKQEVLDALTHVYDPEIRVDIVNLGLVYQVLIDGGRVDVQMTTTAPGCPVGNLIAAEAERAIRNLEGVQEVQVKLVYDPPWSTDRVSEQGRKLLGWK